MPYRCTISTSTIPEVHLAPNLSAFRIAQKFEHKLAITQSLLTGFRELSGDVNPIHVDHDYAKSRGFRETISFGNVLGIGISYLVGMVLPVKEVIILKQSIDFQQPVYLNDTVKIEATVQQVTPAVAAVTMELAFTNQEDVQVAKGKLMIKCL